MKLKLVLDTDKMRQPKETVKVIQNIIMEICGECSIEGPENFMEELK